MLGNSGWRAAPRPYEQRLCCGAMVGVAPHGIMNIILDLSPTFLSLSPLNFHGSFPKHLGSLLSSITNIFNSKNNSKKWIKSTLGIQQINQQYFNNVLQELHFLSLNLLENQSIETCLVCRWTDPTLKYHIPFHGSLSKNSTGQTSMNVLASSSPFSYFLIFSQNPNLFF